MIRSITLLLVLSLNSYAMAENNTYFKGGIGFNYIRDNKFSNHELVGKIKLSDHFPLLEIGFGHYLTDDIRTELVFDYHFLFKVNEESTAQNQDKYNIHSKVKIDTLMLNIYKDVASYGKVTHYIGGGVGLSRIKERFNGKMIDNAGDEFIFDESSKIYRKFAYKLATGIDIKVNDDIKIDVSYNYFNLDNNKTKQYNRKLEL